MIILDTHIWIWWINQTPRRLSSEIIKRIEQAQIIAISAISCFEVAWLASHKRIILEIPVQEWITQATENAGIVCLPVSCKIAQHAATLPEHHKDPQDRIIIATAISNTSQIISADNQFAEYEEIKNLLISM
jgi:PIN domain nuclease of toxin-antitoxin system